MANLPTLRVGLSLDSATFVRETRRVESSVRQMGSRIEQQTTVVQRGFNAATLAAKGLVAGLVGVAGVAGLGRFVTQSLAAADAIGKTADKIGVGAEALQELRFAAERSGVSQRQLDLGLQRFSRRTAEAAQGTGELKKVVEQYGIELRNVDGSLRPVVDVLRDYADVVQNAEGEQEQLRLAFKAFDSEGAALVNVLRQGSEGIEELSARARELGGVLDRDAIDKAVRANDALTDLSTAAGALGNELAITTAPAIANVADALTTLIAEARKAPAAFAPLAEILSDIVDLDSAGSGGPFSDLARLTSELSGRSRGVSAHTESLDQLRLKAQAASTALPEVATGIAATGDAAGDASQGIKKLTAEQERLAKAGAVLLRTSALEERFDRDAEAAKRLADEQKRLGRGALLRTSAEEERARFFASQQQMSLEAAEALARPFDDAASSAEASFENAFANIVEGGKLSFDEIGRTGRSLFARLAADFASTAVFRPAELSTSIFGAGGATAAAGAFAGQTTTGVPVLPASASGGSAGGAAIGGAAGGGVLAAAAPAAAVNPWVGAAVAAIGLALTIAGSAGAFGGGSSGPDETSGSASGGLGDLRVSGSNAFDVQRLLNNIDDQMIDLLNARQEDIVSEALRNRTIDFSFNGLTSDVQGFLEQSRIRPAAQALGFNRSVDTIKELGEAVAAQEQIQLLTGDLGQFDLQVQDLEDKFRDLTRIGDRYGVSLDGLADAQDRAADDLQKAQDLQLSALLDPFAALRDPLEAFKDQIELSTLGPGERLQRAEADFREIAADAFAGNTDAIADLIGAGQLFLSQAEDVGASPAFAAAAAEVQAAVAQAISQVDESEAIITAEEEIRDAIDRHREAEVDTLQEMRAQFEQAVRELKAIKQAVA